MAPQKTLQVKEENLPAPKYCLRIAWTLRFWTSKKQGEPENPKDKPDTRKPIFNVRLMLRVHFVIWVTISTWEPKRTSNGNLPPSLPLPYQIVMHTTHPPSFFSFQTDTTHWKTGKALKSRVASFLPQKWHSTFRSVLVLASQQIELLIRFCYSLLFQICKVFFSMFVCGIHPPSLCHYRIFAMFDIFCSGLLMSTFHWFTSSGPLYSKTYFITQNASFQALAPDKNIPAAFYTTAFLQRPLHPIHNLFLPTARKAQK